MAIGKEVGRGRGRGVPAAASVEKRADGRGVVARCPDARLQPKQRPTGRGAGSWSGEKRERWDTPDRTSHGDGAGPLARWERRW